MSWTWDRQRGPDSEPYSIAYSESSYFTDNSARVVDLSDSPLWSRHVGREVELAYSPSLSHGSEYEVMKVRSGTDRTYVYSLAAGTFGASVLSVLVSSVRANRRR